MNQTKRIEITNLLYSKKENDFIQYLNEKNNFTYPVKSDFFKFLIVTLPNNTVNKDLLFSLFDGLLKDAFVIKHQDYFLIIYHNKERVCLSSYIESFSDDIGQMMSIFEGFLIQTNKKEMFIDFIDLFEKQRKNLHYSYATIADFITQTCKNNDCLKRVKNDVLYKYNKDNQFIELIKSLFENNLNISKTANSIYMHRNTINNKLANLENETGLSIQKFKDAVALYELLK